MPQELFFQFRKVLNDAVVNAHHVAFHRTAAGAGTVAAHMRMRIYHARIPVSGPPGVADTAGAGQGAPLVRLVRQVIEFAGRLYNFCRFRAVADRQSGRIIAAVFQSGQPVQQDRRRLYMARIPHDSAHIE